MDLVSLLPPVKAHCPSRTLHQELGIVTETWCCLCVKMFCMRGVCIQLQRSDVQFLHLATGLKRSVSTPTSHFTSSTENSVGHLKYCLIVMSRLWLKASVSQCIAVFMHGRTAALCALLLAAENKEKKFGSIFCLFLYQQSESTLSLSLRSRTVVNGCSYILQFKK